MLAARASDGRSPDAGGASATIQSCKAGAGRSRRGKSSARHCSDAAAVPPRAPHPRALPQKTKSSAQRRVGVWLIGGRGSVSTCVVYGLAGLREGWLDPTGLITAAAPLSALP